MDKRVAAYFYLVVPRSEAVPAFETVLRSCEALGKNPGDRELALSDDDTRVRLERLAANGEWLEGEVVRVQRDNIPLEAHPEGLRESRAQSQGHSAAFRYHAGMRMLVAERNLSNMTIPRLFRYMRRVDDTARFDAQPLANEDVWERYGRMRPKRFSVTLASITNPEEAEGEVGAILRSSRVLHEITNAPMVQISIRAGGDPEGLEKGAIGRMIEGLLGKDDPGYEVTALSVSAEDVEDNSSEILNFLDDVLKETDEITLNGLSSDDSFAARMAFLRACFAKHMDYIDRHYGRA